jgi:hypothetical protein
VIQDRFDPRVSFVPLCPTLQHNCKFISKRYCGFLKVFKARMKAFSSVEREKNTATYCKNRQIYLRDLSLSPDHTRKVHPGGQTP